MGYKERQPVKRIIIKHGPNKGRVDMSASPLEAKALGKEVNVEELLQAVRQEKPIKGRRYKSPLANF